MEPSELIKNGRTPRPDLVKVKVAVVGNASTQFIVMGLRGALLTRDLNPELFEAEWPEMG